MTAAQMSLSVAAGRADRYVSMAPAVRSPNSGLMRWARPSRSSSCHDGSISANSFASLRLVPMIIGTEAAEPAAMRSSGGGSTW